MSWHEEELLILVKVAPNWSSKYKEYEICTAGITRESNWRRVYPFPEEVMIQKNIRLWDIVRLKVKEPADDPRPESRKIDTSSIRKMGYVEDRNKRREILESLAEPSMDIPMKEKRSMTLIKPRIEGFGIEKKPNEAIQITLNGKAFRRSPYGDVRLVYQWRCPRTCRFCSGRSHRMECFDWGANVLYKRYDDEKEARTKVKQMCYYKMIYDFDTWFALGTHRMRPWKRWMIVGLLWMKKKRTIDVGPAISDESIEQVEVEKEPEYRKTYVIF